MNEIGWFNMSIRKTLTHCGIVKHICVNKLTIIGSDNGLSPGRCQAIIWTNAAILLIVPLVTNFSESQSKFKHFHWKNTFEVVICEILSISHRPQCVNTAVTLYFRCAFSAVSSMPSIFFTARPVWKIMNLIDKYPLKLRYYALLTHWYADPVTLFTMQGNCVEDKIWVIAAKYIISTLIGCP